VRKGTGGGDRGSGAPGLEFRAPIFGRSGDSTGDTRVLKGHGLRPLDLGRAPGTRKPGLSSLGARPPHRARHSSPSVVRRLGGPGLCRLGPVEPRLPGLGPRSWPRPWPRPLPWFRRRGRPEPYPFGGRDGLVVASSGTQERHQLGLFCRPQRRHLLGQWPRRGTARGLYHFLGRA
jgi:hypothetical protein